MPINPPIRQDLIQFIEKTFHSNYMRYDRRISKFIKRKEDREEIIMAAYSKALDSIGTFEGGVEDFAKWYGAILINTAIDFLRVRKHQKNGIILNNNNDGFISNAYRLSSSEMIIAHLFYNTLKNILKMNSIDLLAIQKYFGGHNKYGIQNSLGIGRKRLDRILNIVRSVGHMIVKELGSTEGKSFNYDKYYSLFIQLTEMNNESPRSKTDTNSKHIKHGGQIYVF
ncbi:MAG: hypothetical protein R3F48_13560 [Candidatus Zixiibacteriota bacterium]